MPTQTDGALTNNMLKILVFLIHGSDKSLDEEKRQRHMQNSVNIVACAKIVSELYAISRRRPSDQTICNWMQQADRDDGHRLINAQGYGQCGYKRNGWRYSAFPKRLQKRSMICNACA